jgi:thiol-disulfide isomerase/thioredoxin
MRITVLIIFVLVFASCSQQEAGILPVGEENIDSLLSSKKGKVVLVNLWATWCGPCVEEFPELVKLQSEHDENLDVVFISLDYPEEVFTKIRPFLTHKRVDFTSYYNAFAKNENLMNQFDPQWDGAIPATFIYDKEGKLRVKFYGKRTFKEFDAEVRKFM